MGALFFAYTCALAFSCSTILAYDISCALFAGSRLEEISIVNFRKVANTGRADTSNISFAFEAIPPIQYDSPMTYDFELHWEEEVSGRSGSSRSYFVYTRDYYSRSCPERGNLRRNGQTYQFSVSKQGLGSGPLYVSVSVSLVCNSSISYYYYNCYSAYCPHWNFSGQSSTIRIAALHGSIAAFEVDLELWPEEECHEFDAVMPTSTVASMLLSAIQKNTNTITSDLGIYSCRYLCIHKNFVTMRGVIMKGNNSMAMSMRDILSTWLSEHSSVILGDRVVGIRAGLCGLALFTVNDPVCGSDYPTIGSIPPPTSSKNTASNPQSGSSSSLAKEVDALEISLVSVCFISGGLVIAVAILAAYILYRWRRKRSQRTGSAVVSFPSPDEEDESANLVFREN